MKLLILIKKLSAFVGVAALLCLLIESNTYAGVMGNRPNTPDDKFYLGLFGGSGYSNSFRLVQKGTALYSEGNGGPFGVNAFGESNSDSLWLVGGHLGYEWPNRLVTLRRSNWNFSPAVEMEAFYLENTVRGTNLHNPTTRLTNQDFLVTYPMRTGVILLNAVLNMNLYKFKRAHPYVGVGFGAAIDAINGANSSQLAPFEPGINHYNADTNDSSSTVSAQSKLGLKFDLKNM